MDSPDPGVWLPDDGIWLSDEQYMRLSNQAEALVQLVADAGVDDIDPRLNYIMLQVSRKVWEDVLKTCTSQ